MRPTLRSTLPASAARTALTATSARIGGGTAFAYPVAPRRQLTEANAPTGTCASGRVLVVEDDRGVRNVIAKVLDQLGMHVESATSLAEARVHLETQRFQALVLDVSLPDGDGLSLIGALGPARTLVVSGFVDENRRERSGVEHFLSKPFDIDSLGRALQRLLGLPDETRRVAARERSEVAGGRLDSNP